MRFGELTNPTAKEADFNVRPYARRSCRLHARRADLHISQSDIRPLLRDQLRALEVEIRAALKRGVGDRMTRIHLEDALARIGKSR